MSDDIVGVLLEPLVKAIQQSAGSDLWRHGTRLASDPRVTIESVDEDEIEVRIPREKGILTWLVSLYPNDDEWCCDCPSPRETCEHVCAAIIAADMRSKGGTTAQTDEVIVGQLHYVLERDGATLRFRRSIQRGDEEEPLRHNLGRLAKDPEFVSSVLVHERDLDIEMVLNKGLNARLGRERVPELFKLLQTAPKISLDSVPIRVSSKRTEPVLGVERSQGGAFVRLKPDPSIEEVFENGIVRRGNVLHPLGDGGLSASETRQYSRGRFVPDGELTRFMTVELPDLEARVDVHWSEGSPPELHTYAPKVHLVTRRAGNTLHVCAELIYGESDAPLARVVNQELEVLGDTIPLRDIDEEERLTEELRTDLGLRLGVEATLRDEHALSFSERLRQSETDVDDDVLRYFHPVDALVAQLDIGHDDFTPQFRAGSRLVDPTRVLEAWSRGDKYVPLTDGGFAPLPQEWLAKCGLILTELMEAKALNGQLPKASLPDLGRLCAALDLEVPDAIEGLQSWIEGFTSTPQPILPKDLQATLRDYQYDAVAWLCALRQEGFGALLADDMGLGKTLQALTVIRGRTLVIAPTSVMYNWEKEARRFRPSLNVARFHGPNRRLDPSADITITTYALLRIDQELLQGIDWDMIVLDEAQSIKNPSSQVAQAAFGLRAHFRLALTGTPVENRLEELWSQFRFLNPGLLGTMSGFQSRYSKPIERGDRLAGTTLRARLKPFMLRRMKRDVAHELPPRTDIVLRVELSEEERTVYEALRLSTRREVRQLMERGGTTFQVLEALLRLRQAACHNGLLPGRHAENSSKVTLLADTLDTIIAGGHKALVFSQWTSLLDRIQSEVKGRGTTFLRLDGSTTNRGAVVDRFQSPDGPSVLLLSLKAGGTGLNLTAADHVFIMDPWWNPAVEDQAADRAHRIGQDRPVMVHRLIAADTVEEKILSLQEAKRELADEAMSGSNHGGKLSQADLLALLEP